MYPKRHTRKEWIYAKAVNFGMILLWLDTENVSSVGVAVASIGFLTKNVLLVNGEANP